MTRNRIINSLGGAALCLLLVSALAAIPFTGRSAPDSGRQCPNGPLAADLAGAAAGESTPAGTARYREQGSNRLMVNVRGVNLGAASTSLDVYVGETKVGTISLRRGNGQLRLNSTTATIDENTVITIRNASTVLLTGTFACVPADPGASPTTSPTTAPSTSPISTPTESPTATPSVSPSGSPTELPSVTPSVSPSVSPTMMPF